MVQKQCDQLKKITLKERNKLLNCKKKNVAES